MKEKITKAEFINTWASEWDENTGWKVNENFHKQLSEQLEQLIDQEVEKRIKERMPTVDDAENAQLTYEHKQTDCLDRFSYIHCYRDFMAGIDWLRSRLTKPGVNDSQKTEG